MRNESRQSYNLYLARVAQLNGVNVSDTDKTFAVAPASSKSSKTPCRNPAPSWARST